MNNSMLLFVAAMIIGIVAISLLIYKTAVIQEAQAFCIWNCESDKIMEAGEGFLDCWRFQLDQGDYTSSSYSDLTEDKKVESRAEPGKMFTEDELMKEWESHPDLYDNDCHKMYDLTPQILDRNGPPE